MLQKIQAFATNILCKQQLYTICWSKQEKILSILQSRRSCRCFSEKQIPTNDITKIMNSVVNYPTGLGAQPINAYIVQNQKLLRKMGKEIEGKVTDKNMHEWLIKTRKEYRISESIFWDAPTAVFLTISERAKNKSLAEIDLGIYSGMLMAAAESQKINTIPLGLPIHFGTEIIHRELNISKTEKPGLVISMGYKRKHFKFPKKTLIQDTVKWLK